MSEETENKQTSENTTESTSANEVKPEVTPNLNIRKARKSDVDYIKKFTENGGSMADALHYVIKQAQRPRQIIMEGKTVEVEKEVIKEVPIELTGTQFICELDQETFNKARKCRKFIKGDGKVKGDNYPNELANLAIKDFLHEYYSHII